MSTPVPAPSLVVDIVDLNHDGLGVARVDGKVVLVPGVVPGERVRARRVRRRARMDEYELESVLETSPQRVEPRCAHFGHCAGCSLQHLSAAAQIELKAGWLRENLRRIAGLSAARWLPPISVAAYGYRRRARLSVRDVKAKGRVLVGFREPNGRYVADLEECQTLVPEVGKRLTEIARLIGDLSIRAAIPQIEIAVGENTIVLVVRTLEAPSAADLERLAAFEEHSRMRIHLQPKGPETAQPLSGEPEPLRYSLPSHAVDFDFMANDFVQVNAEVNRAMVAQAIDELQVVAGSRVLDLYCGLGNFTLPVARCGADVLGIEGEPTLVQRARANAQRLGLDDRAQFDVADLHAAKAFDLVRGQRYDRVLLDPPRAGAEEVMRWLPSLGAERIVYVSCHPATLARDGRMLADQGYVLEAAGVIDMFAQTTHIESMAVFVRSSGSA